MRKNLAYCIRNDLSVAGPFVLVKANDFVHLNIYEVLGKDGQHSNWYTSFNGNSKQRRQQRRKFLREVNRA